jgi:hypothetical protein
MIGTVAAFIFHLIQVMIIPTLSELFFYAPSTDLIKHILDWDRILMNLSELFIPLCFSIAGLIFTFVMFYDRGFTISLCWWSLGLWGFLFISSINFSWIKYKELFVSVIILLYIPWTWNVSNTVKSREKKDK